MSICLLFLGGIFFFSSGKFHTPDPPPDVVVSPGSHESAFDRLMLEADAVYAADLRKNVVLYEKNGTVPLPLASISKLLTALVAVETLPAATTITIHDSDLLTEGESGLFSGERWTLETLVSFMLVTSSNDAATALRSAYEERTGGSFIAAMNAEAERIGLHNARFTNETGLDSGGAPSNTGSAQDVATLLAAALERIPALLDATRYGTRTFVSESGATHRAENTNELIDAIPWAVGAKTGFTDSAGGNLAVSFDISVGHPVIAVVLGSSREGRFADMQKLVRAMLSTNEGGTGGE